MRCRCGSTEDVREIQTPWGETLEQCDRCSELEEQRQHEEYFGATHAPLPPIPDPAIMSAVEVDEYADEMAMQRHLSHGGHSL